MELRTATVFTTAFAAVTLLIKTSSLLFFWRYLEEQWVENCIVWIKEMRVSSDFKVQLVKSDHLVTSLACKLIKIQELPGACLSGDKIVGVLDKLWSSNSNWFSISFSTGSMSCHEQNRILLCWIPRRAKFGLSEKDTNLKKSST